MSKIPNVNAAIVAGIREGEQELELLRLRAVAGSDTTAYLRAAANAAAAGITPNQIVVMTRPLARALPPEHTDRLPLLCRLRGHTWYRSPLRGSWTRQTCHRCAHL